jgi:hypothetical protein
VERRSRRANNPAGAVETREDATLGKIPDCSRLTAQIDIHSDGTWVDSQTFSLKSGETIKHGFP